ncbi:HAD family hydrolase [Amphibacillus sp. Q70]|uniref:HAD family hydrolase n=1 Tax=Amphibacillus sp. Q70 TaxID=3453416 RepID=UPI003F83960E
MVKHVVFDMGNVLIRYAPAQFIQTFTSNKEHQEMLLKEIFYSTEWLQYDKGTITKHKIIDNVKKRLPEDLHSSVSVIMDTWFEKMTPIPEMEEVIKRLKKNEYSIYLLSNVSNDFYRFKHIIPGLDYFDGIFISSDWKCIKPEPEIYQQFFEHFDLEPADCFFIDDLPINIERAASQGMQGYVFDGNISKLLTYFEKIGIMTKEK